MEKKTATKLKLNRFLNATHTHTHTHLRANDTDTDTHNGHKNTLTDILIHSITRMP